MLQSFTVVLSPLYSLDFLFFPKLPEAIPWVVIGFVYGIPPVWSRLRALFSFKRKTA